jgi:hypothetical protein
VNVFLWILQVLLALHTAMGAVWKFSQSEQAVPALAALPHGVWLALSVLELVSCVALLAPAISKSLGRWAPLAAVFIVAEMLLFTVVNLASASPDSGQIVYWLVVAAVCAFLAYGRFALEPIVPAS